MVGRPWLFRNTLEHRVHVNYSRNPLIRCNTFDGYSTLRNHNP
jgi:hypothetical protein